MRAKKRVIIADDHPLLREGVRAAIERSERYEVVAEAENGVEALERCATLKPDLVVMDLSLPDRNGIEVSAEVLRALPGTAILVLSMHSKVDTIVQAFKAGVSGYVTKDAASERLIQALDAVAAGETYLDSAVSGAVMRRLVTSGEAPPQPVPSPYDTLTPREQQVTVLLAEGLAPKQIAKKLFISPKTVENHRSNIMRKLDLHSTHELVRFAAKVGLIDLDLWTR